MEINIKTSSKEIVELIKELTNSTIVTNTVIKNISNAMSSAYEQCKENDAADLDFI